MLTKLETVFGPSIKMGLFSLKKNTTHTFLGSLGLSSHVRKGRIGEIAYFKTGGITYLDCDGTADALLTADGPELLECSGVVDGGLVVAGGLQDIVCAIVDCDGTLDLSSR